MLQLGTVKLEFDIKNWLMGSISKQTDCKTDCKILNFIISVSNQTTLATFRMKAWEFHIQAVEMA